MAQASSGLADVIAGTTSISQVTQEGLRYRGYDIADLAAHCCYEEVAYLLLYGELPARDDLESFRSRVMQAMQLPAQAARAPGLLGARGVPVPIRGGLGALQHACEVAAVVGLADVRPVRHVLRAKEVALAQLDAVDAGLDRRLLDQPLHEVVRFRPPRVEIGSADAFERVVRGLFLQRRKTLANALKPVAASFGRIPSEILERARLDGGRRPETLTVEDVARLSQAVL